MLKDVPIKDIDISENYRKNIKEKELFELTNSIKDRGLLQPIGVAKDGKRYKLRFGQRRLLAFKALHKKTIPAIVENYGGRIPGILQSLVENMQRTQPSFEETGCAINELKGLGLTTRDIATRTGIPKNKVQEIFNAYSNLTEVQRRDVVFVKSGSTRENGKLPALIANKIAMMKKSNDLKDEDVDEIIRVTKENNLQRADLNHAESMIKEGMSSREAMHNAKNYGLYTFTVALFENDVNKAMRENGLMNRQHLLKKIFYGEIKPLPKPDFVFTGISVNEIEEKKKRSRQDDMRYARFRRILIKHKHNLTDLQLAALEGTKEIPANKWTQGQCEQLENIYYDVFKEKIERGEG